MILFSTIIMAFWFFQSPLLHHLVVSSFVESRGNWQEPPNDTASENTLEIAREAQVERIIQVLPRDIFDLVLVKLLNISLAAQQVPQN